MSLIALEGMRFYANHGFYEEEQIIGGWYTVDVYLTTNFTAAAREDDLNGTLNYETIYLITKFQMAQNSKLLEHIAHRIADELKHKYTDIQQLRVKITKHAPPLGGNVERAIVEYNEDFQKKCAKCSKPLLCYNDKNCWCKNIRLSPEISRMLQTQYNGCMCKTCLKGYGV